MTRLEAEQAGGQICRGIDEDWHTVKAPLWNTLWTRWLLGLGPDTGDTNQHQRRWQSGMDRDWAIDLNVLRREIPGA